MIGEKSKTILSLYHIKFRLYSKPYCIQISDWQLSLGFPIYLFANIDCHCGCVSEGTLFALCHFLALPLFVDLWILLLNRHTQKENDI